jgi:hypothetical protein
VVANPLHAVAVLLAGEDVKTDLGPVVDALGEFDGLVLLVVGGIDAIDEVLLAFGGEVGMQLDHEVPGFDGVRSVDLDLIVALGAGVWSDEEEE